MRNDPDRLTDIAESSRSIARFVAGLDDVSFAENDLVRSAVFAKLIIIGEAARNLSAAFRDANPQIPWAQIVGTRNRIAHGYDHVDWQIVWHISTSDVPQLLKEIEALAQRSSD
ncbi:MAG: DUF86 domain-containing protein [Pirellulales bacterium]